MFVAKFEMEKVVQDFLNANYKNYLYVAFDVLIYLYTNYVD